MNIRDLKIGDKVRVRTRDIGIVIGTVTEVEEDIKNGSPGIGFDIPGDSRWCYDNQVLNKVA